MFEQSFYNQDLPVQKAEAGDFLYHYEIKNWNFTPRLYKIIAMSAVVNLLAIIVVAQTSLLTMKGCDSPFVNRVCQVLDTVYVGSILFGTDREYVDQAYEKTDLADADITYVDVTGVTPPLDYPPGYFAIANPEQYAAMQTGDPLAGFNPTVGTNPTPQDNLLNTAPVPPPSNPNAVIGDIPSSPLGNIPDAVTRKNNRGGRIKTPKLNGDSPSTLPGDSNTVANNTGNNGTNSNTSADASTDEAKADQFGFSINKRPMKDLAVDALAKIDANTVKIDQPFKVVIAGTLGLAKDGKTVILKDAKVIKSKNDPPNDPDLEKLAQSAIIAVGNSGYLGYLDRLRSKKVVISVEQNDAIFVASLRADQPSENDARQAASGLNSILTIAAQVAKGDELAFLKSATTTSEKNTFILNIQFPKKDVQDMIMRKLAELKENEGKPSGSAQAVSNSNNTAKR